MVHARLIGASILTLSLVLSACGDDDDPADETSEETTATTEEAEDTTTTAAEEDAAITVQTAETDVGTILVDGEGNTLYGFTVDTAGTPTCSGGCATNWPALLVEGEPQLGEGSTPRSSARSPRSRAARSSWPVIGRCTASRVTPPRAIRPAKAPVASGSRWPRTER